MKTVLGIILIFSLSVCALILASRKVAGAPSASQPANRTPVIVELFTSEGCSSCPPADALLSELSAQQPVANAEVIALEEHVDYWDHQGWADPFSSLEFTSRQQAYSFAFGSGSVYTPQMIVDGQQEFVGSREDRARHVIQEAAEKAKTDVAITPDKPGLDGTQSFTVCVGKLTGAAPSDTVEVWLAVTETGLHSAVTRGENAGEDLHHAAVVRTLRKIGVADKSKDLSFAADPSVPFKPAWKRENLRVVVFVQEKKSRKILGAVAAKTGS